MTRIKGYFILGLLLLMPHSLQASGAAVEAQQKKTLKISHQFPGGTIDKGDFRDRLCRIFAKKVEEKTKGALKFEIYPGSSLMKTNSQFDAMRTGPPHEKNNFVKSLIK